jgi:hypothetical protein
MENAWGDEYFGMKNWLLPASVSSYTSCLGLFCFDFTAAFCDLER